MIKLFDTEKKRVKLRRFLPLGQIFM